MKGLETTEPTAEKREINELLADMKKQRHDYLDDLPEERVTFEDPNYYLYKCRTNWWHYIALRFEGLLARPDVIDDPAVAQEIKDFLEYVGELDFHKFRTRADIDRANVTLDVLIGHMEKKAGNESLE